MLTVAQAEQGMQIADAIKVEDFTAFSLDCGKGDLWFYSIRKPSKREKFVAERFDGHKPGSKAAVESMAALVTQGCDMFTGAKLTEDDLSDESPLDIEPLADDEMSVATDLRRKPYTFKGV
jgi:hypothetical protein